MATRKPRKAQAKSLQDVLADRVRYFRDVSAGPKISWRRLARAAKGSTGLA